VKAQVNNQPFKVLWQLRIPLALTFKNSILPTLYIYVFDMILAIHTDSL